MPGRLHHNVFIFQGQEVQFELVYKKTYKLLLAKARSMLDDISRADDVVQELFINLWERKRVEISGASLEAYLMMSMHYKCLKTLNEQQRLNKKMQGYTYDLSFQQPEYLPDCLKESPIDDKKLHLLQLGRQSLSHNQREVIRKCYDEGKSQAETAAEMNIKKNTLKSHLERSLAKFKDIFQERCGTSL
jgi:RNA polymerase sigma factor (sigma-70 family)